jgi:hypothetical protein
MDTGGSGEGLCSGDHTQKNTKTHNVTRFMALERRSNPYVLYMRATIVLLEPFL